MHTCMRTYIGTRKRRHRCRLDFCSFLRNSKGSIKSFKKEKNPNHHFSSHAAPPPLQHSLYAHRFYTPTANANTATTTHAYVLPSTSHEAVLRPLTRSTRYAAKESKEDGKQRKKKKESRKERNLRLCIKFVNGAAP